MALRHSTFLGNCHLARLARSTESHVKSVRILDLEI